MFKLIRYFIIKPFFIWLLIFAIFKAIFLVSNYDFIAQESFIEILKAFTNAIKLDYSSIAYILLLPFLIMIILYFSQYRILKKINTYYHYLILFLVSVINSADVILYQYWNSKVSLKALSFLEMPDQVYAATGFSKTLFFILLVGFQFIVGKILLEKFIFKSKIVFKKSTFSFFFFTILCASFLIITLRGGLQEIPINQSVAYYSNNSTLNIAGVNPLWNVMNLIFQNKKYLNENPYKKLSKDQVNTYVDNLYSVEQDTSISLFNIEKPNIVLLTLEGVNAQVFNTFNSSNSFAPNIESLFKDGLLFTNMYASGFRSDQGLVAMLGGFPPAPISSIAAQPAKFIQLPSLTKKLKTQDYSISFYTGVEPEFGNLKSYLISNNFDKLIDIKDFPQNERTQNLGVPDEYLFKKVFTEMKMEEEPFFSMIFTATTHEPYDMPFNKKVQSEKERYLNTVQYLDTVLYQWFQSIQEMSWYDNTIFILTSDHAHYHPGNYAVDENKRYQIPFLIFGSPLKNEFKGQINDKICSQVDIPKTILNQLKIESKEFEWSKDMMNPYSKEFAFYTFVEGSLLKTKDCNHGWEYRYQKPIYFSNSTDTSFCIKQNQAYLQKLYDVYLEY